MNKRQRAKKRLVAKRRAERPTDSSITPARSQQSGLFTWQFMASVLGAIVLAFVEGLAAQKTILLAIAAGALLILVLRWHWSVLDRYFPNFEGFRQENLMSMGMLLAGVMSAAYLGRTF